MSWLRKHIKIAQNFPLSVNGLMQMKESTELSPDVPGQAYLFQGPEISELSRLRGQNSPAQNDQIIKMMHNIFFIFGEEMDDEYDYNRKIDEYELDQEMESYAEMIMQDYQFDDDKMWSMIGFLSSPAEDTRPTVDPAEESSEPDDDSLQEAIKAVIGSGPPDSENFRALYNQLKEAENNMRTAMDFDSNSVIQGWREAIRQEQAGLDGSDAFNDALAAFTSEVLQAIVESRNEDRYLEEELPSWLPEDGFLEALQEHDRGIEWYIDEHKDGYGGLKESASESIGNQNAENFSEQKREWEHRFGFDIVEYLAPEYDPEDEEDPRRDISLPQISEMTQMLASEGYLIKGGTEAAQKASAIIFAVKELASQDENMKFMFSNDLNMMTWDSDSVIRGVEGLARENNQYLFGPMADQVAQRRQRIEEQREMQEGQRRVVEEQRRREEVAKLEEQRRIEDEQHQMLPRRQETTTPEQLQQMQDLGIAKRPFGHETQLNRGTFPGAGVFNMMRGMTPFTMSIAPTKDYVDKGKIPPELMRNTLLHTVPTEGQPALGWVGGFADYENKVLYIAEVQSDLMQRTGRMRDPEKVQKQREQEVATIQQQITDTQSKIQNVVNPKQQMQDKIDRINQETQQLAIGLTMFESTPRQTTLADDPVQERTKQKIKQNEDLMRRLQQQLQKVPDTVDTRNLEFTLQNLNKSLVDAQQRLQESVDAEDTPDSFQRKYRPWHDYKSKVENTFKEWIPIFFNSAFRLARDKGYTAVRIVTADNLMKLWDKYARPETRTLFERVYDQTVKFYGAQQVNVQGKTWWEVKMTPDTRVANWLQRLVKIAQAQHQWFMQDPTSGKFVWQIHLDVYFQKIQQHAPEMMGEQWEAQSTDYAANEGKRSVFEMWLAEVPPELKMGGDLDPNFKQAVRQYLVETQNFDPYEFEEAAGEADMPIPSAEEMDDWLG